MTLLIADGFFQIGNYVEAAVWMLVAGAFAVFALKRHGSMRWRCALACAVFLLFGLSDVVEVRTGAWWRPWWLFCWKAICVLTMIGLLLEHLRRGREAR